MVHVVQELEVLNPHRTRFGLEGSACYKSGQVKLTCYNNQCIQRMSLALMLTLPWRNYPHLHQDRASTCKQDSGKPYYAGSKNSTL